MAMLPMLLVLSFAAPHAWSSDTPAQVSTVRPVTVEQVTPVVPEIKVVTPALVKARPVAIEVQAVDETVTPRVVVELPLEQRAAAVQGTQMADQRERADRAVVVARERDQERQSRLKEIEAELAMLESRLRQETESLKRQEELFQRGLVTKESLAQVEERVATAMKKLDAARALSEAKAATADAERVAIRSRALAAETERMTVESQLRRDAVALERQRELAERGLVTRRSLEEVQAQVAETRQRVEEARAASEDSLRMDLRVRGDAAVRDELVARGLAAGRAVAPVDPDTAVQPQDRLTIVIAGEPDLPTSYTVRADGSIRFPFLGVIRVAGSTAGQIQSVIRKLIVDKGLAGNPDVTVSIGRTVRRVR